MHGPIKDDRIVTMTQRELDEAIERACDRVNRSRWATFVLALSVLFIGLLVGSLVVRDQVRAVTARLQSDIDSLNETVAKLHRSPMASSHLGLSDNEWQAIEEVESSLRDGGRPSSSGLSATATTPDLLTPDSRGITNSLRNRAATTGPGEARETWDAIVIDEQPAVPRSHKDGHALPRQWEPAPSWPVNSQRGDTNSADGSQAPASVDMERPDSAGQGAPAARRGVSVPPPIKRTPRPTDSVRSTRRVPQAVSFSRRRDPAENLTTIGPERPRPIAVENVSPIR